MLALDVAAAFATGRSLLGQPPVPQRSVMYLDLEMTEDDVRELLADPGYGPNDDLSRLAYFQLAALTSTAQQRSRRQVLDEIGRLRGAELVIVGRWRPCACGVCDRPGTAASTTLNLYNHVTQSAREQGTRVAAGVLGLDE